MTKRESIIQAIKTKLDAVSGLSGNVYRSRIEPFLRSNSPAALLTFVQDVPEQLMLPIIDWTMRIKISLLARADVPDSELDVIVAAVHGSIMADISLGGLTKDIQPGPVDFQVIEADKNAGVVSLEYVLLYRTLQSDLTA